MPLDRSSCFILCALFSNTACCTNLLRRSVIHALTVHVEGFLFHGVSGRADVCFALLFVYEFFFCKYQALFCSFSCPFSQIRDMGFYSNVVTGQKVFDGSVFAVSYYGVCFYACICLMPFNERQHYMGFVDISCSGLCCSYYFTRLVYCPVYLIT